MTDAERIEKLEKLVDIICDELEKHGKQLEKAQHTISLLCKAKVKLGEEVASHSERIKTLSNRDRRMK